MEYFTHVQPLHFDIPPKAWWEPSRNVIILHPSQSDSTQSFRLSCIQFFMLQKVQSLQLQQIFRYRKRLRGIQISHYVNLKLCQLTEASYR